MGAGVGGERVREVPPPEAGPLAAPLQGRRQSTVEGEQGEGPRGVPAPQSSWGLLTQDEGPTSGKDRGCVLNPTEGGSEVSRGAAGLENGDRVWTRKTQGQRKGQQDSSKHGGSGLPLGRQGGRGGGRQRQRRQAPKEPRLPAVSPALPRDGAPSSHLASRHLLDRDLRGGGSLRDGYRSLPSCSRL